MSGFNVHGGSKAGSHSGSSAVKDFKLKPAIAKEGARVPATWIAPASNEHA